MGKPRRRKKKTYEDGLRETPFQRSVFELLRVNGFRLVLSDGTLVDLFFHAYDSRKTEGAGITDIVCVHPRRLTCWFIELKSNSGRLSPKQRAWGKVLAAVDKASGGRVRYRVWRPRDWESMVEELGGNDSRLFA